MSVDTGTYRFAPIDARAEADVEASFMIASAVRGADLPDFAPVCRDHHVGVLRHPWPGQRTSWWLAYRDDQPVATATVELPELDNLDNVWVDLCVHPDHRRAGAGRALYRHVVERARAAGRRRLMGVSVEPLPEGPHRSGDGGRFARALGAQGALHEVRRRLDLTTADTPGWDRLLDRAWARAPGYSLLQWRDGAPEDAADDLAYLEGRLNLDAPTGDLAWEPERYDAARLRAIEEHRVACGTRTYHSAVRHDASGRVVGWTYLLMHRSHRMHALQGITLVDPEHRGRRLGTVVKVANLPYVTAAEPALRYIDTWNADTNSHMIAINDALGFRPVDRWVNWQLDL
jgi:GNAT superfamily N-acetyltransferase